MIYPKDLTSLLPRSLTLLKFLGTACALFVGLPLVELRADPLQVDSLEGGQCWASLDKEGEIKLTHFGRHQAMVISKAHLHQLQLKISDYLQGHGLEAQVAGSYEAHVQCRSEGLYFYLNFPEGDIPLCVHVRPELSNQSGEIGPQGDLPAPREKSSPGKRSPQSGLQLQLVGVYSNHGMGKGPCEGQMPGDLILHIPSSGSSDQQAAACKVQLKNDLSDSLLQWRELKSAVFVKLRPEYLHRENLVRERILEVEACEGILSPERIEYNSLRVPIGETLKAWDGLLEF